MGKGAFVTIRNESSSALDVSYSNFTCMYRNGDQGSDFGPISGPLPPKGSLPGGRQYIEAKASGGCATKTSTFTMTILDGSSSPLTIHFTEKSSAYHANPNCAVNGRLSATTSVESGKQYEIDVVVRDQSWKRETWMTDLGPSIASTMLSKLAIPGTHDSGTYGIRPSSKIAPKQDIPEWVNVVSNLGVAGRVAKATIAGWAKTQPHDFSEQLAAGIRYFDLRVVLSGRDYWLCHSMYSVKLSVAIAQIQAFLNQHPKEIVILDFNHLFQMDDAAQNDPLVKMLIDAFGNRLAPSSMGPRSTIGDFQAKGYQVIALYDDYATTKKFPQQLWSQGEISSPYQENTNLDELKDFLDSNLATHSNLSLFVLQGILTPDGGMIAKGRIGAGPGSIKQLAAKVTPAVTGWVQEWAARGINIVIVDWYTVEPLYVDTIIRINTAH